MYVYDGAYQPEIQREAAKNYLLEVELYAVRKLLDTGLLPREVYDTVQAALLAG